MLENHYPIHNLQDVRAYCEVYIPLVKHQLNTFKIDTEYFDIKGDHLGLQVISHEEFDLVHEIISGYSEVIKQGIIHERRNNTYKLNEFIDVAGLEIQSIEMFEQKPNADISKLKPGIEHISLTTNKFDELEKYFNDNGLPIAKSVTYGGSRFFKTKLVNLVEIEFRDDCLWKDLIREKEELERSSDN